MQARQLSRRDFLSLAGVLGGTTLRVELLSLAAGDDPRHEQTGDLCGPLSAVQDHK